jgi:hypothetical protein
MRATQSRPGERLAAFVGVAADLAEAGGELDEHVAGGKRVLGRQSADGAYEIALCDEGVGVKIGVVHIVRRT